MAYTKRKYLFDAIAQRRLALEGATLEVAAASLDLERGTRTMTVFHRLLHAEDDKVVRRQPKRRQQERDDDATPPPGHRPPPPAPYRRRAPEGRRPAAVARRGGGVAPRPPHYAERRRDIIVDGVPAAQWNPNPNVHNIPYRNAARTAPGRLDGY
jgi:hypothetical protein